MEEVEYDLLEGIWTVADVMDALEKVETDARAYLDGDGLDLAIDGRGDIFTEAEDGDVVGCHVIVFGEYEERLEDE